MMHQSLGVILFVMALAVPGIAQEVRPYDDSDPEMRSLLDAFFDLTPCGPPGAGICPEAQDMLRGGGDRLATYLIRQYEGPEPPPPLSRWTYLRLIGHTESTTAFDYLSTLVATQADSVSADPTTDTTTLTFALEGLGRTKDPRIVPQALALLDRFPQNPDVRIRAVGAVGFVQLKHGPQPEVITRLTALQTELATRQAVRAESGQVPSASDAELASSVEAVLARSTQP
jgi:hypothetical protein